MYGSKEVLANNLFGNHDCIFKVITFPGHESNHEVSAEGELAVFGGIAFSKNLAVGNLLGLVNNRNKVYTGILVGFPEFWQVVMPDIVIKTNKLLFVGTGITDNDFVGIHIFYYTITFS